MSRIRNYWIQCYAEKNKKINWLQNGYNAIQKKNKGISSKIVQILIYEILHVESLHVCGDRVECSYCVLVAMAVSNQGGRQFLLD